MTPHFIFFPFTHVTQGQLDVISAFLPSFYFLSASSDLKGQPRLKQLEAQKKLFPLFVPELHLGKVDKQVEEYFDWVRIHKGNEKNLRSLFRNNPYFTDDTFTTSIKSQIKKAEGINKKTAQETEKIQAHLLFLKMADIYDSQNNTIEKELLNVANHKQSLLSNLRGLEKEAVMAEIETELETSFEPGVMMPEERVSAWFEIMAANSFFDLKDMNPVFFTTSDAVFDYIGANCHEYSNALDIDKIKAHENECENKPGWQKQFVEKSLQVIQGDWHPVKDDFEINDQCGITGKIKIRLYSGNTANDFFQISKETIPACLIKLNGQKT